MMDRQEIVREWEKEFMHEVIPWPRWQTLFARLAGNPHTRIAHHPQCLVGLEPDPADCTHCKELNKRNISG